MTMKWQTRGIAFKKKSKLKSVTTMQKQSGKYRIVDNLDVHSSRGQELAQLGRRLVEMAEKEMPGLVALRTEYEKSKYERNNNLYNLLN